VIPLWDATRRPVDFPTMTALLIVANVLAFLLALFGAGIGAIVNADMGGVAYLAQSRLRHGHGSAIRRPAADRRTLRGVIER
jgi:hypothetical protein